MMQLHGENRKAQKRILRETVLSDLSEKRSSF
jgi:hypothetical protein